MTFRCRADSPTVYSRLYPLEFLINGREAFCRVRETNRENGFPFTVHIRHRYGYGWSRIFLIKKNMLLGHSIDTLLIFTSTQSSRDAASR